MALPENGQQFRIADLPWIEFDPDRFAVVADVTVIGVAGSPAGIADRGSYYPWDTPEPGVDAPESAEGEDGEFRFLGVLPIDGRHGALS